MKKLLFTFLIILWVYIIFRMLSHTMYWNHVREITREKDTYGWMVRIDIYRNKKENKFLFYIVNLNDPTIKSLDEHLVKKGY